MPRKSAYSLVTYQMGDHELSSSHSTGETPLLKSYLSLNFAAIMHTTQASLQMNMYVQFKHSNLAPTYHGSVVMSVCLAGVLVNQVNWQACNSKKLRQENYILSDWKHQNYLPQPRTKIVYCIIQFHFSNPGLFFIYLSSGGVPFYCRYAIFVFHSGSNWLFCLHNKASACWIFYAAPG